MNEPITEQQLRRWLVTAEAAARHGAEKLEEWRTRFSVREKSRADLVTEADIAAQRAIHSVLHATFPDHGFLGEEDTPNSLRGRVADNSPPTWIVDPLDGTTNYVHDVPFYCVSIGLMVGGRLVVGVIFDPRQRELYAAAQGLGATLNGAAIRVSSAAQLKDGLISTGFPPDPEAHDRNLVWWRVFAHRAQALRRTGSTALNLAYVACGRFDGYWAFDNHPWDVAAGIVLTQEAGGQVSRVDGSQLDVFKPDLVATNGRMHTEMLDAFRKT